MKNTNQLKQSSLDALRNQVEGAKKPMEIFLECTEKYRLSLGLLAEVGKLWRIVGGRKGGACVKVLR